MNPRPEKPIIVWLSMPLAILVVVGGWAGLSLPDTYLKETLNGRAQAVGQDAVDLILVAPMLIVSAFLAQRKNIIAMFFWGGTCLYLIYTYTIFCFDVHFNNLFLIYCFTLGLAFYSFIYFVFSGLKELTLNYKSTLQLKVVGYYLMGIAVLFYALWLSDILPAVISSTTPASVLEVGLPTNPVHVIDLAIFLPGLFLVSVFVLTGKKLGLFLAPVMLVFTILMNITIAVLVVVMMMNGIGSGYAVAVIMSLLALVSAVLLLVYLKNMIVTVRAWTERDFPNEMKGIP
ncbi:MAG: hypothetical protein ABI623_02575 [bacterium]